MRYIDIIRTIVRNASEKDIPSLTWNEQRHHLNAIRRKIDDIEIVVRCKDCRYVEVKKEPIPGMWCNRFGLHDMAVGENCFCSWGKQVGDDE